MIYWTIWWSLKVFFQLRFSFQVKQTRKLDYKGPLLVAANHVTNWDPFVIHASIPVHMAFMAKEELFKIPVLGWIMKHEKAISVRRGAADRQAIRDALEALKNNRILGIFPEGTRSPNGSLRKFQPGMTMLAVKAQSPVLPVWLDWSRKGKVTVIHGELLFPPDVNSTREEQEAFTERVKFAMLELANLA